MDSHATLSALLEQLVYIDNFMNPTNPGEENTPNLDIDGQLLIDLAAFADDSFIFPDEETKPRTNSNDKEPGFSPNNLHDLNVDSSDNNSPNSVNSSAYTDSTGTVAKTGAIPDYNILNLPKFPVPPGAKLLLVLAGLSQNQIDLLSALIAQHQLSLGNGQRPPTLPTQAHGLLDQFNSPVRQHSQIQGIQTTTPPTISSSATVTPTALLNNTSESDIANGSDLDKRKRNTAALARFRIKKKLKEKQMEGKILNLTELIKKFELKVQQLEMENKLLRNLIIEKGLQKSDDELKLLKERATMK